MNLNKGLIKDVVEKRLSKESFKKIVTDKIKAGDFGLFYKETYYHSIIFTFDKFDRLAKILDFSEKEVRVIAEMLIKEKGDEHPIECIEIAARNKLEMSNTDCQKYQKIADDFSKDATSGYWHSCLYQLRAASKIYNNLVNLGFDIGKERERIVNVLPGKEYYPEIKERSFKKNQQKVAKQVIKNLGI